MDENGFLVESSGVRTEVGDQLTIGRELDATVSIEDPAVSRHHAVIRRSEAGFEIEDLRSANGTYVNARLLLAPTVLRNGDRITVGTHELQFAIAQPRVITDSPTVVSRLSNDLDPEKARTMVAPFTLEDSQSPLPMNIGLGNPNPSTDVEEHDAPIPAESGWPVRGSGEVPPAFDSDFDDTAPYPEAPADEVVAAAEHSLPSSTPDGPSIEGSQPVAAASPPLAGENTKDGGLAPGTTAADGERNADDFSQPSALHVVAGVGRILRDESNLSAALGAVAQRLVENYKVGAALFFLAGSSKGDFRCLVAAGEFALQTLGEEHRRGEGIVGRSADEKSIITVADHTTKGRGAAMVSPIELRDGSVWAVLELIDPQRGHDFGRDDQDFAALVTQQLGLAFPLQSSWTEAAEGLSEQARLTIVQNRFVSLDPEIRRRVAACVQAVQEGRPVYLWGEVGTGRRHLARIANQSAGGDNAVFETFDCAANGDNTQLPALFDPQQGAWTRAESGMLCLTHVEALRAESLEAIQARVVARTGPRLAFTSASELVGPTAGSFTELVEERCFHLPPLRERLGDLPALATLLLEAQGGTLGGRFPGFTDDGRARLEQYSWPGNVAELKGLVLQLTLLGNGKPVTSVELSRLASDLFRPPAWGTTSPIAAEEVQRFISEILGDDRSVAKDAESRLSQISEDGRVIVIGAILRAVESSDVVGVKARGIEALGARADERLVPYAAQYLTGAARYLTAAAIISLGNSPVPAEVAATLAEISASSDVSLATLALLALGRVGGSPAIDALRTALTERVDWKVAATAAAALAHFDPSNPAAAALYATALRLGAPLPAAAIAGAYAAGVLDTSVVCSLVLDSTAPAEQRSSILRAIARSGQEGVADILGRLGESGLDAEIESTFITELANFGQPALPVILRLLDSAGERVRRIGLLALCRLPTDGTLETGLRMVASKPDLLQSLRQMTATDTAELVRVTVEYLDADWRLDAALQLLELLAAARQEQLIVPASEELR